MVRVALRALTIVAAGLLSTGGFPAHAAAPLDMTFGTGGLCGRAIDVAERRHGIPRGLLFAIGLVETARLDPVSGTRQPQPWVANIGGNGRFFATARDAERAVAAAFRAGDRNVDVGCMQVNLQQHPAAFRSLQEAFDPTANADYAARFLLSLQAGSRNWMTAAGLYHSHTPDIRVGFQRRVEQAYAGSAGGVPNIGMAFPVMTLRLPRQALGSEARSFGREAVQPLVVARLLAIDSALASLQQAEAARVARMSPAREGRAARD